ncbi:MAG: ABC transporter substrate-binding protein [Anaerolineaceae bacterium]|nr:ABC transporter substrate-binding protein [Anaerolineaceae bacterium]
MDRLLRTLLCPALIFLFFGTLSAALADPVKVNGMEPSDSLTPEFAVQFSVDYYENGIKLLRTGNGQSFLLLPEEAPVPEDLPDGAVILRKPVRNIYLAATAVMCLFDALDSLDAIRFSGTKADGWYIENARKAMEAGKIIYAGKYSEPDYELLLENRCPLAVESQMIGHASDVKEKLEELGTAVLVDLSSSEPHPLGRTEWIRFYGALLDKEEKADELFRKQKEYLNAASSTGKTGKTAAFFHISSSGMVVVRKSGDYVSKMIELAGGKYVFDHIGDPEKSTSTVTIGMEEFFVGAKDADVIIYNSTIAGEVNSLAELLSQNALLETFKAVKEGNVWCTSQDMYQDTTQLGRMIQSLEQIFSGSADDTDQVPFFSRLK